MSCEMSQQIGFDEVPTTTGMWVPDPTPAWRRDWERWLAVSRARQARYRAAVQAANHR